MHIFWMTAVVALAFSAVGFKKYVWFISIGYGFSVAAIGVALLIWLPVLVFLFNAYTFLALLPAWIILYYSTAAVFARKFMKKPFNTLIEYFAQQSQPEAEQLPAEGETAEETVAGE
jgi:hypothetical protein